VKRPNNPDDVDNDDSDSTTTTIDVYSALSKCESQSEWEYSLPRHRRCDRHTLNLIATADADKAESDTPYKKVSRSTFAKCHALWNKYSRSAMAVEAVNDAYRLGLKRPNATRWNSVYMATTLQVSYNVAEKPRDAAFFIPQSKYCMTRCTFELCLKTLVLLLVFASGRRLGRPAHSTWRVGIFLLRRANAHYLPCQQELTYLQHCGFH